jgi:hypothetical protein
MPILTTDRIHIATMSGLHSTGPADIATVFTVFITIIGGEWT